METLFRLFMFLFPYDVAITLYVWMLRKAKRVPNKSLRALSFVITGAGLLYTLYRLVTSAGKAFKDDRFQFEIIVITIIVLFFAAIAMAFGEPEK